MDLNKLARAGAFSRGVTAKQRGQGKKENPFPPDNIYHEIWLDGWYSIQVAQRRSDEN